MNKKNIFFSELIFFQFLRFILGRVIIYQLDMDDFSRYKISPLL